MGYVADYISVEIIIIKNLPNLTQKPFDRALAGGPRTIWDCGFT
jgi:hypothetical protein